MSVKTCTKCGEVKRLEDFSRYKRSRDGLFSNCKACKNKAQVAYIARNREACNSESRLWQREAQELSQLMASGKKGDWSKEEDQVLLAEDGRSLLEKAISLGRTRTSVTTRLSKLRRGTAATQPRRDWTQQEVEILMADDGLTVKEKSELLGRSFTSCKNKRLNVRKLDSSSHPV